EKSVRGFGVILKRSLIRQNNITRIKKRISLKRRREQKKKTRKWLEKNLGKIQKNMKLMLFIFINNKIQIELI
ncbi:unnamed protein product, partial [Larinioides sclopetarius]